MEIPEELAGQTIECPACKASLAVPAIEVPPPATPQIRVTAPQASAPQKPATKRKIAYNIIVLVIIRRIALPNFIIHLKICLDFALIVIIIKKLIRKITEQSSTIGSEIDF